LDYSVFIFKIIINNCFFQKSREPTYNTGDYIAAAWLTHESNNRFEWYLGLVERFDDGSVMVSYFQKTSKTSTQWHFPEGEDIHKTKNQIFCKIDHVSFQMGKSIRCRISKSTAKEIDSCLTDFISNVIWL